MRVLISNISNRVCEDTVQYKLLGEYGFWNEARMSASLIHVKKDTVKRSNAKLMKFHIIPHQFI